MTTNLSIENNALQIIDKDLIINWNTVITKLSNLYIIKKVNIQGTIAEKYRSDMYGLFKYLGVEDEFIYPHIRVNGFNSSREYNSSVLEIKMIDLSILNIYYEMFTK